MVLEGYILEDDYPSVVSAWVEEGTVDEYIKNHPECDLENIVSRYLAGT